MKPTTAALLLALAVWPGLAAHAQDISAPPLGYPTPAQLSDAHKQIDELKNTLTKEQARAKAAQQAADQAQARATQAERALAAAQAQVGKASPEQLAAQRRQLDTARAEATTLRGELAQANDALKRLKAAANDAATNAAELARLHRQSQEQQDTIGTLRSQLATERKALAEARAVTSVGVATATVPTPAAGTSPAAITGTATVAAPPDLSELTVANCGAACPKFVLIPNRGPVTIDRDNAVLRIEFKHRYAMAITPTTVGQWKAFISETNYRPEANGCDWDNKNYSSDDSLPVVCVTVADANAYANWFSRTYIHKLQTQNHGKYSKLIIKNIRIPTELEWEFAARSDPSSDHFSQWPYPGQNTELCYGKKLSCVSNPKPVFDGGANIYGLYDMGRTLWELTSSPWREKRTDLPLDGKESPSSFSGPLTVRGAHHSLWRNIVFAHRQEWEKSRRAFMVGFRLVAEFYP